MSSVRHAPSLPGTHSGCRDAVANKPTAAIGAYTISLPNWAARIAAYFECQCFGENKRRQTRTALFGLNVIFYQMLGGVRLPLREW